MGAENVLLELIGTVNQRYPVQACAWPLPTKNIINWRFSGYRFFARGVPNFIVILWVIMSKKCYINILQIINHYTADSILIYIHDCNLKF